jgi:RNA polymerase sigma-70 factor (ECF subfamily)
LLIFKKLVTKQKQLSSNASTMQNDQQHIQEVLQGNTAAYAHLVEQYQSYVFTITHRILSSREEAEEAAQDTFVKAFRRLKDYRHEAKFTTWLYPIARNTAIDYKRKKTRITASIDEDERFFHVIDTDSKGQFAQLQAKQRAVYIEKLINQLPEEDAMLITLFYLKEQSIEEIAKISQLSTSNIKVKLFRLRKKLKKKLQKMLEGEARELI